MSRSPKKTTSLLSISAPKRVSKVKLLSTDFDGTLVGPDTDEDGLAAFFDLLKEQRRTNKLKWVINTGRSWETLEQEMVLRGFPTLPDWVVLAEREVYRIHREHPVGDYEWNQACEDTHADLFQSTQEFWHDLEDFIGSQTAADNLQDEHSPITIRARNDHEAARIHQYIAGAITRYPNLTVMRNSVYFRFAHAAYHKGSALQRIQQLTGLKAADTMAIGDHYNDLPMLHSAYAVHLACPHNAIDEVKEAVVAQKGLVAKRCEVDGLLETWKSHLA